MTETGRWTRAERLYHEALERSESDRNAFLEGACAGDAALREEVESLLGYDGEAGDFLSEPAVEVAARLLAQDPADSLPRTTSLTAGTRLGPYEILSSVGAGGMGEVYRARDPRLGRDVALKVVAGDEAPTPERLRRFEREARAVAALNHPHILAVYDVGSHEGQPYVVFELLRGETLRKRLARGPLPVSKAVEVSTHVCHALATAHAQGVVHRDLKPENLFLAREGGVKLLDFGLAKLREAPEAESDEEPTVSATGRGAWVGTPGYIAPEQLRGARTSGLSDVFAVGAVLYEMITGHRAFGGASRADTLAAILHGDPPPMTTPGGPVPLPLERVVRRCLEKDPEDRFQSVRDVAFALEALSTASGGSPTTIPGPKPSRRRWFLRALAAAALVAGISAAAYVVGRRAADRPTPSYHRLSFRRGTAWGARFARGGQTIVYGAAWEGQPVRLFTTRADSPESRTLDLPDADILAISSRDEMAILLDRDHGSPRKFSAGTLARVPLAGGAPRVVLEGVYDADWSPDGGELAVVRSAGQAWQTWPVKVRLEFPVGRVLFETDGGTVSSPRVSPRGDLVAFVADQGVSVVDRTGVVRTLDPLATGPSGLAWSPSGDEIWYTDISHRPALLQAVSLAGRRRRLDHYSGPTELRDVSRDGRALLTFGDINLGLAGRRAGETRERDLSWFDGSRMINLSADGELVLFTEQGEGVGGSPTAYIRRTDGSSPPVRLGEGLATRLSPDGKWVVAQRGRTQLVLLPTGPGEAKVLEEGGVEPGWTVFSADGKHVVISGSERGRPNRTWIQDIGGGRPRPVTPEGVIGHFTPDGRSLLTWDRERRLSVYAADGGDPLPVPGPPEPGQGNAWADDGHSLYVTERRGPAALVFKRDITTGSREPWMTIEPADPAGVLLVNPDLAADGKSYVYSYTRYLSSLYLVDGLN